MSLFHFRQFHIDQRDCAMKIGTDGILLGAWADLGASQRILDIGTGTGLLALMLAQKHPTATIDAIEREKDAAARAAHNFAQSPWGSRLVASHAALQEWQAAPYEAMICNPPFFTSGPRAAQTARSHARHTDSLSFGDLALYSARLSTLRSQFALIVPFSAAQSLTREMEAQAWSLSQQCSVRPLPQKPFHRALLKFERSPQSAVPTTLTVQEAPSQYHSDYIKLTRDFYAHTLG